jgi:sugar lactone lactonase YvrE
MEYRILNNFFYPRSLKPILALAVLLLLVPGICNAQPGEQVGADSIRYMIGWMKQVTQDDLKGNENLINKIGAFILGAEPVLLKKPVAIMARDPGRMWILDQDNQTLLEISGGKASQPGCMKKNTIHLPSLVDMCMVPDVGILFTDSHREQILMVEAGNPDCQAFHPSPDLDQPTGIAYSPVHQEIWVAETGAHCISVFNLEGKRIRKVGKRGTGPGEFNFPTYIAIDQSGHVYVVDAMNFRVQILDATGAFLSAFGGIGNATGYFASPKGIAVDSHGFIYVADARFHAVQVFNRDGTLLSYFGTQGHDQGEFWMPAGLFIDEADRIYVADSYNSRIQIFEIKPVSE